MPTQSRTRNLADQHFIELAKSQFQFLIDKYGYVIAEWSDNSGLGAVLYRNAEIHAGVSVGMDRRDRWVYVCFINSGAETTDPQAIRSSYYLNNILSIRSPEAEATLSKHLLQNTVEELTDELSKLASYTSLYADDVLKGDFKIFGELDLTPR